MYFNYKCDVLYIVFWIIFELNSFWWVNYLLGNFKIKEKQFLRLLWLKDPSVPVHTSTYLGLDLQGAITRKPSEVNGFFATLEKPVKNLVNTTIMCGMKWFQILHEMENFLVTVRITQTVKKGRKTTENSQQQKNILWDCHWQERPSAVQPKNHRQKLKNLRLHLKH